MSNEPAPTMSDERPGVTGSQIPDTMRAVRLHAPGGAEKLTMESIPVPSPGAGQLLVKVEASGVNFIDTYKRSGLYKVPLPATLGEEGAGHVVARGDDVTQFNVGDRVAWAGQMGSYAEYAIVGASRVVAVPADVSMQVAAAIMLQGMTAHYLAASTYSLKEGDRCLVHAAAGGVGLLLVQIAKLRGAEVIATVGTDEKAELARAAGADHVIVYTREDFVAESQRMTSSAGVNVVYDSVGKSTFMRGFDILRPRGTMVLFGQSSGPVEPFDPQVLNRKGSIFLTRPSLAHYIASRQDLEWRATELFGWIGQGQLSVRIGAQFPLADVANAHRALEGRRTTGKVLLQV